MVNESETSHAKTNNRYLRMLQIPPQRQRTIRLWPTVIAPGIPLAGPHGTLRILQIMPHTAGSWQRINSLQRLGQHNPELPSILEFHRKGHEIVSR